MWNPSWPTYNPPQYGYTPPAPELEEPTADELLIRAARDSINRAIDHLRDLEGSSKVSEGIGWEWWTSAIGKLETVRNTVQKLERVV
jgi:hypothetical protein